MEKLYFSEISFWEKEQRKLGKERRVFNFLNLHDIYWFRDDAMVRESFLQKENINFSDGFMVAVALSLKSFKKVIRVSGPVFTRRFFENKKLSGNKKHFFIGNFEKEDIDKLVKEFRHLDKKKLFYYNPPYIQGTEFPPEEINKIIKLINSKKPDCVWAGLGSPKQNILTAEIFKKTNAKSFFNVGAAIDFVLEKKKEAPVLVREFGVEWLYRLVTDFKHTFPKVVRSFRGLFYSPGIVKLKKES